MKLSHLKAVAAVSRYGSLRAAGRHLDIAQPTITRSIREIEHELGVSLFERHAKGSRLTPIGEALASRARIIEAELQRAQEEVAQLKGQSSGQVSAVFSTASVMVVMPKVVEPFRKRYPSALLRVREGLFQSAEADIRDGHIDFFVGPFDMSATQTSLKVDKLFDNQRYVICRRGHRLRDARNLADLVDAEWIRPSLATAPSEVDFEAWFEGLGLPRPHVVLHCNSALSTFSAVANSNMLTILPQQWVENATLSTQIEALKLDEPLPSMPICVARRRDLPLTPMAEFLYEQVRKFGANYSYSRAD